MECGRARVSHLGALLQKKIKTKFDEKTVTEECEGRPDGRTDVGYKGYPQLSATPEVGDTNIKIPKIYILKRQKQEKGIICKVFYIPVTLFNAIKSTHLFLK